MSGFPAYYINRKLFACSYEEGAGIKVVEKVTESLAGRKGIVRFQPEGRKPMKEWIQINRERSEDYHRDQEILNIPIDFVSPSLK